MTRSGPSERGERRTHDGARRRARPRADARPLPPASSEPDWPEGAGHGEDRIWLRESAPPREDRAG